jgi:phenylalanyl-tRNA synthetase alpha chain
MPLNLEAIRREFDEGFSKAATAEELEKLKVVFLGRKGKLTEVLRGLSALPAVERKSAGEKANVLKIELEALVDGRLSELRREALLSKLKNEKIDITLPAASFPAGRKHPLRKSIEEMTSIFESLGFTTAEGPEIETDWYNFEALNIPPDHPARDSQDTFYLIDGKRLLRTHTSPVQVHVMEKQKPPVRIIVPGRVFRNEATDASHAAVFHQIEGLAVDENIKFSDLKGILTAFVHRYYGAKTNVRFRPSHFQFTEPSAELDVQCTICGGKGCRVCKGTGWLELLGCGMVHPNVLKAVNYDTEKYTGFAFGVGVERLTMLKYGIDDMRLFIENNIEFLRQF